MVKIFVMSDNLRVFDFFYEAIKRSSIDIDASYFCSQSSYDSAIFKDKEKELELKPLNMKKEYEQLLSCDVGFSAHCKQIFPAALVNSVRCINIHPGYNPYNRGWFPQVFSMINGLPAGFTVHEMDEEIDHGAIIDQERIKIKSSDTSLSFYNKVMEAEGHYIQYNLDSLISGKYEKFQPCSEGNYNSIKDFNALCEIDLKKSYTAKEWIDFLRGMSHPPYKNAYFVDEDGNKVYCSINLTEIPFNV